VINGIMIGESFQDFMYNCVSGGWSSSDYTNQRTCASSSANCYAASLGICNDAPATVCPQGYYFDAGLQGCTSLGPAEPTCLDGYHFSGDGRICESDQPNGKYPGCPAGQIFDPSTGMCDAQTTIVSITQLVHTQSFQLNLPDCSIKKKSGPGCQLSAQACGQKKFDPTTCTCN
jgi:hypothetical protein